MNELALFAGVAGGLLGSRFLGWRTVCAVEIGAYPRRILLQRQREGCLPLFPIWDDVRTFDGTLWKGKVDIVTGGFPCQPYSTAIHGKHNADQALELWPEMYRIIREVEPRFVFGENVDHAVILRAAADCIHLGYKTEVLSLSAANVGANHQRVRHWFLGYTDKSNEFLRPIHVQTRGLSQFNSGIWTAAPEGWERSAATADKRQGLSEEKRQYGRAAETGSLGDEVALQSESTSPTKSRGDGMVDGLASRLDRYSAIGEGQVPAVSTTAFSILAGSIFRGE